MTNPMLLLVPVTLGSILAATPVAAVSFPISEQLNGPRERDGRDSDDSTQ